MSNFDVKSVREQLGLTQQQLAAVMGYGDKARVSELERNARQPSPAAERLLEAYLSGYRPSDWPPQISSVQKDQGTTS